MSLPTANGLGLGFRFLRVQAAVDGETAHGGAVGFEGESAEQFGGDGTVTAAMFEQVAGGGLHFFWPRLAPIAARASRSPLMGLSLADGFKVGVIQLVKAARAQI